MQLMVPTPLESVSTPLLQDTTPLGTAFTVSTASSCGWPATRSETRRGLGNALFCSTVWLSPDSLVKPLSGTSSLTTVAANGSAMVRPPSSLTEISTTVFSATPRASQVKEASPLESTNPPLEVTHETAPLGSLDTEITAPSCATVETKSVTLNVVEKDSPSVTICPSPVSFWSPSRPGTNGTIDTVKGGEGDLPKLSLMRIDSLAVALTVEALQETISRPDVSVAINGLSQDAETPGNAPIRLTMTPGCGFPPSLRARATIEKAEPERTICPSPENLFSDPSCAMGGEVSERASGEDDKTISAVGAPVAVSHRTSLPVSVSR